MSRMMTVGALASILVLAAYGPSAARSDVRKPQPAASAWLDDATGLQSPPAVAPHHATHPHCTDGYPMHHFSPCGTATGGPAGGLH